MTKAILLAITRLSVLKFFPTATAAQGEIMDMLERMVSDERQLEWLVDTLIDSVDEWPGLRSVRGLFCTRFKPRDGKETTCGLPGFTAEDCEGRAALLEPARLLSGTTEAPMASDELQRFHDELLAPLLRKRQPPRFDREAMRRAEQEIAEAKKSGPKLSEEEKDRRIHEIEAALGIRNEERP